MTRSRHNQDKYDGVKRVQLPALVESASGSPSEGSTDKFSDNSGFFSGASRVARRHRASAPFVAHLAGQYESAKHVRSRRVERRENANATYAQARSRLQRHPTSKLSILV